MGRRKAGNINNNSRKGGSFGDQWYLEQTLKLRATKLNKQDEQIINRAKMEQLIPILRYSLVVYMFFNTLLMIEDFVNDRAIVGTLVRFFIVTLFLLLTFISSFLPFIHRAPPRVFFILSYLCLLVQVASNATYHYISVGDERSVISVFLPLDTFFIYLFVRFNMASTAVVCIVAMGINEAIALTVADYNQLEIANVVLYFLCNILGLISGRIFELNLRSKYFLSKEIEKDRASVFSEREKSERLLYNILPRDIADSLKNDFPLLGAKNESTENDIIADSYEEATIAFCDICNFTVMSGEMHPEKLVSFLNDIFSSFDNLLHEYGLEKIKTIGDAYMFAGGLSRSPFVQTKHGSFTHAEAVVEMALSMQRQVDTVSQKLGINIKVRIGVNTGSVVAGIVGISKFVYDLFGETVNLASKLEAAGQPERVHVSQHTYEKLKDKYDFEPAQECVEIKDKCIRSYFLLGRKGRIAVAGKSAATLQQSNLRQFIAHGTTSIAPPPAAPADIDSFSSLDVQSVDEVPITTPSTYVEVLDPIAHANETKPDIPTIGAAIIHASRPGTADSSADSSRAHANSLHEIVSARARSPLSSARGLGDRAAIASARARSPLSNPIRADSRGAILAGGGGSQYGYDSRPTSPANLPLHHHGSAARMEDGATATDAGNDTSYTPPSLGFKDVISFEKRAMEIKYRKDYFRKYFRLIQLNAIGGLFAFIILGVLCLVSLENIDYTVLLAFAVGLLLVGIADAVFFTADETRMYMHYMPVLQSTFASFGLLIPVILLRIRHENFEHDNIVWNCCIIMILFVFVFPGLPFQHMLVSTFPAALTLIISVAIVDNDIAFQIIVRVLMVVGVGVCISYRKEQESRGAFFVTQGLDDERRQLVAERSKSERLLYSILPQKIAAKLKMNEASIADTFNDVTVMFVSIHNFTSLTANLGPFEKVYILNKIFSKFDKLVDLHKLEKIKTIGPTYLVVGGLPVHKANHLSSIAELAIDMQEAISTFTTPGGEKYKIKGGIHCGKVVAGVIGIYKFSYDLWGDTVNTASRMESHSLPGKIQLTETAQKKLAARFEFADRGFIQVKGKGVMHTYFLTGKLANPNTSTIPATMPSRYVD